MRTLRVIVEKSTEKELNKLKNRKLKDTIKRKLLLLKKDPELGTHISRSKIPKEYIKKYELTNLWKINLPNAHRIIYTLKGNETELISFIIDVLNHKDYEKKFNY